MTFRAKFVVITARASTTESMRATDVLAFSSAPSAANGNMFASQSRTGGARSIKHIVINAGHVGWKNASRSA